MSQFALVSWFCWEDLTPSGHTWKEVPWAGAQPGESTAAHGRAPKLYSKPLGFRAFPYLGHWDTSREPPVCLAELSTGLSGLGSSPALKCPGYKPLCSGGHWILAKPCRICQFYKVDRLSRFRARRKGGSQATEGLFEEKIPRKQETTWLGPSSVSRWVVHQEEGIVTTRDCLLFSGGGAWRRSCYVAQAALELVILLPPPPEYWDYSCILPCLAQLFHI
jgi:hypothetical protein